MKKENKNFVFIILMLLFCISLVEASKQNHSWHDSLFKLLKLDTPSRMSILSGPDRFAEKEKVRRLAIHNINKHIEELQRLRALGKTEEEIRLYFNSLKEAVGTGSISGMAYESNGKTHVQNYIAFYAYNEYGQYSGFYSIHPEMHDGTGVYTFKGLPAGKYYVRTLSQFYIDEYYDNVTDWRDATLVPVAEGKETSGINFILDSSRGEGAISGQVLSVSGNPLMGCLISVYDENYNWVNSLNTDENGLYVVDRLRSGRYKLQVAYGGDSAGEWYDDAQSFETATVVTVTEPFTTEGINFVLDYRGAIEGKVFDATGRPVGANDCGVWAINTKKKSVGFKTTDENGNFAISRLKTGVYRLRIDYYGQGNYLDGWYDGAEDFESATPVIVTTPDTMKDVHITLKAGGAISGRVFNYDEQPVPPRCLITAYDENRNYEEEALTDENGHYTILKLFTGRYKLFARYIYDPLFWPANEWYDGVYEFEDAIFVEVTAPGTTENINFKPKKGGSIGGYAYGPEGPLPDRSGNVVAYNLRGDEINYSEIHSGLYSISRLLTGNYKLHIWHSGGENYKDEWYDGKQNFETADHVSVTAPNMTPDVNFTLEYPGIIQGFVTDAAGNRLIEEEYFIQIYAYDAHTGEYIDFNENSFAGGYKFELLGRDYKLAAISLYSNRLPKYDNLAAVYYEHGESFIDSNTQTISLAPETSLNLNDLVMDEAAGAISGTVYDECYGEPLIEGFYLVLAFDEGGYLVKASVYSEDNAPISGNYQLHGLKPGNYYLLAIAGKENAHDLFAQWYSGIVTDIDLETLIPKLPIPANASPVTVGEGLTEAIDFYFGITPHYTLTIASGTGGTTDPLPGIHTYAMGTEVTIIAIPKSGYRFDAWSGDVSGSNNPITITMDSKKSIKANFIRQYDLTIQTSEGGTTDPSPGTYTYDTGTEVTITAIPDNHYIFNGWGGDVSGAENPIVVTVDSDKSVKANFRKIYSPSAFKGEKVINRSLSQAEYINVLSWEKNPNNEGITISNYRIYQIEDSSQNLLMELSSRDFKYWHRKVEKTKEYKYAIVVVSEDGREGEPAYITVK